MTLISSLSIAKQALGVNEAAITTISNNIANVDTEGYSKLRVNLASVVIKSSSSSSNNVITGVNSLSGVEISSISRYSNAYLQGYYWGANSSNAYLEEYSNIASNIESLTNELQDSGLSSALSNFYDAVNALSDSPSDATARANYITAAQTVCSIFNSTANSLSDIRESLVGTAASTDGSELVSNIDQANEYLNQLANINEAIVRMGNNSDSASSSSLLDQRDSIITKLSSIINVDVDVNNNGTVSISLGNNDLVRGSSVVGSFSASNSINSGGNLETTLNIVDENGQILYADVNDLATGGSIGAILASCGYDNNNLTISGVVDSLNTLAQAFANIMNTIQTGDPSGDGSVSMCLSADGSSLTEAMDNIFVNNNTITTTTTTSTTGETTTTINSSSTGITAANLTINPNVLNDKNLIAAARLTQDQYQEFITTGEYANAIGNNSNVVLMQASRSNTYNATVDDSGNITYLGNKTIESFLTNMVGDIGNKVENINTGLTTQTSVLSSIENQLSSETGVNLDEELTDLIKFQRAYEAAARVFSTCSDILAELVALGA